MVEVFHYMKFCQFGKQGRNRSMNGKESNPNTGEKQQSKRIKREETYKFDEKQTLLQNKSASNKQKEITITIAKPNVTNSYTKNTHKRSQESNHNDSLETCPSLT